MSTTTGELTHPEIDQKIAALLEELQAISPEALTDGKAKAKAIRIREEIDGLELEKQLQASAEQELARRAEEERQRQAEEARSKARAELAAFMGTRSQLSKAVEDALTGLINAARKYRESNRRLLELQRAAGRPVSRQNRHDERLVYRIGSRLAWLSGDFPRRHDSISLHTEDAAVAVKLKEEDKR